MINPDAKLRWINTNDGVGVQTSTVENLFSRFITKSVHINDDSIVIHFYDSLSSIYIHDMFGYTPIVSIIRSPVTDWLRISNADNLEVSDRCFMPVYDINDPPYQGFHGEVKRHYTLKHLEKISSGDRIRIYDSVNKIDDYIIPSVENDNSGQYQYGYFITTRSRFCTINGVHMFASDSMFVDEAIKTFGNVPY